MNPDVTEQPCSPGVTYTLHAFTYVPTPFPTAHLDSLHWITTLRYLHLHVRFLHGNGSTAFLSGAALGADDRLPPAPTYAVRIITDARRLAPYERMRLGGTQLPCANSVRGKNMDETLRLFLWIPHHLPLPLPTHSPVRFVVFLLPPAPPQFTCCLPFWFCNSYRHGTPHRTILPPTAVSFDSFLPFYHGSLPPPFLTYHLELRISVSKA